jgi:hypothetical protein
VVTGAKTALRIICCKYEKQRDTSRKRKPKIKDHYCTFCSIMSGHKIIKLASCLMSLMTPSSGSNNNRLSILSMLPNWRTKINSSTKRIYRATFYSCHKLLSICCQNIRYVYIIWSFCHFISSMSFLFIFCMKNSYWCTYLFLGFNMLLTINSIQRVYSLIYVLIKPNATFFVLTFWILFKVSYTLYYTSDRCHYKWIWCKAFAFYCTCFLYSFPDITTHTNAVVSTENITKHERLKLSFSCLIWC